MRTRVRFADGDEHVQFWPPTPYPSPAANLALAVADAEEDKGGEAHAGAWLEFVS